MEPNIENSEVLIGKTSRTENRLASEKSPYLLQHASNPVDWFPWGDEAFEKAKKEDKPIFLSIGYSTCHWCHVMEHESFEDEQVASLLNKTFVSIKVDREERPDIDHIYMTVCQLLTGSGGWPLTIIMTPDKEPFFAATYIPKTAHFNQSGMLSLIPAVADAWKNKRFELTESSSKIVQALEDLSKVSSNDEPGEKALHLGFFQLTERFDDDFGGFGKGMKFPTPHQLVFLLRYWKKTGQEGALEMAEKTLTAMRKGGIFDHVGFGFHRYSTDRHWLVPHFEKMLYDQALLLYAYTEAFQATKNPFYKKTALEIGEYVLRDMTSPEGGFYSAEDADSEGEEGKFYFYSAWKVRELLDKKTADLALQWFGIKDAGNFQDEASGRLTGQNILHEGMTLDSIASKTGLEIPEIQERLESARKTLFEDREKRTRPLLDDKILTDWNGLMIGALAGAGRVLNEPKFVNAAKNGVQFIRENLTDGQGHLLHRYRDGEAGLKGYLDDYAFLVFGLIELFESTYDPEYLEEAIHLNNTMIDLFQDQTGGGFYLSARDAEKVLVRPKELYDGAIPSGNSVAFHNLARLSRITGNSATNDMAVSTARSFHGDALTQPSSHSFFLSALDFALGPSVEIVIAGDPDSDDTRALLKALDEDYSPNRVVIVRSEKDIKKLVSLAPYTASQVMLEGKATAYVCVRQSCSFPTTDLKTMLGHVHTKLEQERGNR